jgi:asparagine synthase (glutamine-hydrolysing)
MVKKINSIRHILPKPHNKLGFYTKLYRLLDISSKDNLLEFYLSSTIDIFEGYENSILHNNTAKMKKRIEDIYKMPISNLNKMMLSDDSALLFSNLLIKMDIATMSNSLEARSPFLSIDSIKFATSLNDNLKINKKTTKYLLRELSKKYLPKEIVTQPKRGFEIPLKNWLDNDLREILFDKVSKASYSSNFIDKNFIDKLLYKKISISDEKRAKMLWAMLTLEIWKEVN